MAEIPNGDYIHRSIDQLRNEQRGALNAAVHDYKQFTDLRNNIVADYASKVGLNNNNSLIDNRNTISNSNNQSTNHLEHKNHHQYSSTASSTSNTSLDAQMNEGKIFAVKSEQHQSQMRETKPYKCTQCTKSFANSSYLSQHTRIHLGIKPYRCEICQRKFTQLSHLQQHIRTHTGDKPYKCRTPGCVKAFSQLSNLQSHSRCHATDKPYKCNACYKCFIDETALLDHIPKHKESKHLKTHICQYCGKSYTQETYLAKHLQKHIEKAEKQASNLARRNNNISTTANNNNATHSLENPYWPKISPESAENLQHHQQQQTSQYNFILNQPQNHTANENLQGHRTILEHHHRNSGNNNSNGNGSEEVEDLVVIRQNPTHHLIVSPTSQAASNNQHTSIVVTSSPYDSVPKSTSNSAFTPINVMPSHLNTLQHHQLSQRPLYYDAIAFQNSKNMQQNAANSFPNQLISLSQIRNYTHQPGGLAGEHLIGIGIGAKEKGQ